MSLDSRGLWHRDRRSYGKWLIAILLVAALLVPPLWLARPVLGDPSDGFIARRGELVQVQTTRQWQTPGSHYRHLTLTASTGLQVDATVRRPNNAAGPRPLIVLLGGYGTGRDAAELVTDPGGMVVASIAYPYHGPEKLDGWGLVRHLGKVQQAVLDITPALLLTLEHLAREDYVDSTQMELVGVSLGAFFVSVAGAMEERFSRVWLVQGAADPRAVYEYRLREYIGFEPLRVLVARVLGFYTATEYLKPERWVGKISPRRVVVINSRGDSAYPPASVATLHASLREPYELEWLVGEHVTPGREQVLKQLNERVVQRISAERNAD